MLVDPVKHYFYIWLIQPLRKQKTKRIKSMKTHRDKYFFPSTINRISITKLFWKRRNLADLPEMSTIKERHSDESSHRPIS